MGEGDYWHYELISKLALMGEGGRLKLLAPNGMLVKYPIVVDGENVYRFQRKRIKKLLLGYGKGNSMEINVGDNFSLLFDKNNNTAYKALQILQKECEKSDKVYYYMDKLADMIDNDNSYIRTRGLTLIAYNAKWDKDNKIDEIIDEYLKHIEDVKPITARQCIKLSPMIAKNKPELKENIVTALQKADISIYAESMQSLVYKDIQNSLAEIEKL